MHGEIIAIGDELTSGQRLDTNTQWLSQRLGDLGIRVLYHTTVGDDLNANIEVFRHALDRADIVIATGGLGPTADDLTRESLAAATDRPLKRDDEALAHIRSLFERRGREMPESNSRQAFFPKGSRVVHNPNGSAPGIDLEVPRDNRSPSRIFCLPGVPAEMKEMWNESVQPSLLENAALSPEVIHHYQLKCFGIGESDLEAKLPDLIQRGRKPSVGITVSQATITLRISDAATNREQFREHISSTVSTIHECLGELVFGEEDEELQHVVGRMLAKRGKTLATAEWGTGGLLAQALGDTEQAADSYLGGLVIPRQDILTQALGISNEFVAQHGAISQDVAAKMAATTRELFDTDFGLAIGGFPTYTQDNPDAGRYFFSLATPDCVVSRSGLPAGHPEIVKPRCVKQALNLLRLHLLEQS